MPTFSEMFPTYGRLISNIGRLVSNARPGGRSRNRFATPYRVSTAPVFGNRQEDHYSASDDDQPLEALLEQAQGQFHEQPDEPIAHPAAAGTPEITSGEITAPDAGLRTGESNPASHSTPVLSSQETGILRMYQAWVELESNIANAQENLAQILASRGRAAVVRRQAQEVLEQGEELREEAQRIGDAAWRAFDRGFATNIRGFANRRAMVREIDLSRRTQAELQRNVHRKAWEEVERTRENATKELIKILDSVASVAGLVQRELGEASTLPGLAQSLRDSAQEELRCAEAIKDELLLLGTEALNQLGVTPTSEIAYNFEAESPSSQSQGLALGLGSSAEQAKPAGQSPPVGEGHEPGEVEEQVQRVPGSLSWEASGQEVQPPIDIPAAAAPSRAVEPEELTGRAPKDDLAVQPAPETAPQAPAPQPPAAAQREILHASDAVEAPPPVEPRPTAATELLKEMEVARASVLPPEVFPPASPPEAAVLPPVAGEIIRSTGEVIEPPAVEPESRPSSVAEQLMRDMEAARSAVEQPQAPTPSAAEELARELESLLKATTPLVPGAAAPLVPPAPLPSAAEPQDRPEFVEAPQIQADVAPASAAAPVGNPPAPTYSGRLNLMFPPTLTQDEMGIVWEALEEVSKGGQILDSRLLSSSEGIQFTIQLGPMGIIIEDLTSRLPGSAVSELEPDRLKVDWPQPR